MKSLKMRLKGMRDGVLVIPDDVYIGTQALMLPKDIILEVIDHTDTERSNVGDIVVTTGNNERPFITLIAKKKPYQVGSLWYNHIDAYVFKVLHGKKKTDYIQD
jgi:hypothetical protein